MTLIFKLVYRFYRVGWWVWHWVRRRFTLAGLLVVLGTAGRGLAGELPPLAGREIAAGEQVVEIPLQGARARLVHLRPVGEPVYSGGTAEAQRH